MNRRASFFQILTSQRTLLAASTFFASLLLGGVGHAADACENGEVKALIIGDIGGRMGMLGPGQLAGTQAAIDMINAEGGLLGCKISLTSKDEQIDPAVAVRELRKEIATNRPQVLFGPTISASMLAMSKITNAENIPLVSGTGGDASFVMDHREPGNYMAITTLYQDAWAAAKYLAATGKCKNYGFFYIDGVAGRDAVAAFEKALTEYQPDAQIVTRQGYSVQNKDFGSIIQAISNSKPDCVFGNLLGPDLGTVYRLWSQRKLDIATMFYPDSATLKSVGNGNLPPNAYGFHRSNVKKMAQSRIGQKFVESYKAANNGAVPDEWVYSSASAVFMWAAIVKAANSFDYDKLDAATNAGGLTFSAFYGDGIEILPNHQANVWTTVGPLVDDRDLGYPYWSADAEQIWTRDAIPQQLFDDILAGKVSTRAAAQ